MRHRWDGAPYGVTHRKKRPTHGSRTGAYSTLSSWLSGILLGGFVSIAADHVVRIFAAQYRAARAALGRAFVGYRLMEYVLPAEARRQRAVPYLYGGILADSLRWGEVYSTAEIAGAACWLPPGVSSPGIVRQMRCGMWKLPWAFGVPAFRKLLVYDDVTRSLHHEYAPGPHWYLAAIGVEPAAQGRGLAGQLMQPVFQRADAAGLPCYLETHTEKNVRVYQRSGFEVCTHREVPGHDVSVWAMLRPPRTHGN